MSFSQKQNQFFFRYFTNKNESGTKISHNFLTKFVRPLKSINIILMLSTFKNLEKYFIKLRGTVARCRRGLPTPKLVTSVSYKMYKFTTNYTL